MSRNWDETCKVRGIYQFTVVANAVTAVSILRNAGCATNPSTLVLRSQAGGATVNVTWTAGTTQNVSLGGTSAVVQMASAFSKKIVTVATPPACAAGTKYYEETVSDSSAPTYGATITGGGAVPTPVVCDGTNWKAH